MSRFSAFGHHAAFDLSADVAPPSVTGHLPLVVASLAFMRLLRTASQGFYCGVTALAAFTANFIAGASLPQALSVGLIAVGIGGLALLAQRFVRIRELTSQRFPRLEQDFNSESLGLGYHDLYVESAPVRAATHFRRAAEESVSPYDRTRALFGIVAAADRSKTSADFAGALGTLRDFMLPIPPDRRLFDPGIQLAAVRGLRVLAEKMMNTRYERIDPQRGSHPYVNPDTCRIFCELFRSLGPQRDDAMMAMIQIPNELLRTVGEQSVETRVALAEMRGVLFSTMVSGGPLERDDDAHPSTFKQADAPSANQE